MRKLSWKGRRPFPVKVIGKRHLRIFSKNSKNPLKELKSLCFCLFRTLTFPSLPSPSGTRRSATPNLTINFEEQDEQVEEGRGPDIPPSGRRRLPASSYMPLPGLALLLA